MDFYKQIYLAMYSFTRKIDQFFKKEKIEDEKEEQGQDSMNSIT